MHRFPHIFLVLLLGLFLSSCDQGTGQQSGGETSVTEVGKMAYGHKVLALQFTSVGCTGCPAMTEEMKIVQRDNPDVIIPLAFHMNYGMLEDPMAISVVTLFQRHYKIEALPGLVVNFRKTSGGISADRFAIASAVKSELTDYPAECGVAISTEYDSESRVLKVNSRIATNVEARYRYHVFLVEDGISGIQLGAEDSEDYTHGNVVRKMLSSDIYGKAINGHKPLPEGYQASAYDRVVLEEGWNEQNMRVVVAAMTTYDDGMTWVCANAGECRVGDSADYKAVPSVYRKQIAVWEFTGAWCAFCPEGYNNMSYVISRNEDYKDRVHVMAFHSASEGNDPMAIGLTDQIRSGCGVKAGYPSYIIEMRADGPLTGDTYELKDSFRRDLAKTDSENPAHCGVAVSSTVSGNKASIEVKVASEKDDAYRVAVFVVENGIVSPQNVSSIVDDDYVHDHVVRKMVSSSYLGDRLGNIARGDEAAKTFEAELSSQWNIENTYVYALAINGKGYVNNMNICRIDGGESSYLLK